MKKPKPERFVDEIKAKFPNREAARVKGSRKAAIHLHCIECVGGEAKEARNCTAKECFLWPFRPGTTITKPVK